MHALEQFYSNEKAKQTLVNFITDGRLPHALLLEGEDGCGKTHFARLIAACVLCTDRDKPCGSCRSCRLVLSDTHPDVILHSPDDEDKPYSVASLRELILSCYVLPNDGERKVYLLRNIHEMSEQAQNTLLKIIEEPPDHVLFVLTCHSRAQILPTILSRVLTISLAPCPVDVCAQVLQELSPDTDWEECQRIARRTDGNVGKGLRLLKDEHLCAIYQAAQTGAQLLCGAAEYDFLCLVQSYNRKRDDFLLFLAELRHTFVLSIKEKNDPTKEKNLPDSLLNRISTLQAMKIIDIIDMVSAEVTQNVGVALSGAHLCGAVKQVLHG